MFNRIAGLHRDEAGNESMQRVAIIGVAVLLLIIFQKYGKAALETVNGKISELLTS